jgi:hypothetical protein
MSTDITTGTTASSTDVSYLVFPLDDANMASSLAGYLTDHGLPSVAELNEVTCPLDQPGQATTAHQLRQAWTLYWQASDAELYSLPIFIKNDGCAGCTEDNRT